MPTRTARATMLWPMLNSPRSSIRDRPDVAIGQAVPGMNDQARGPRHVAGVAQLVELPFDLGIGWALA